MSMTLYAINKAIEETLDAAVDPETGEIVEADLFEAYNRLQMDRTDKIENIGCFIKDLDAEAKAIREEEKALAVRRRIAENKAERLRGYLAFCLKGERFNTPRCSVQFRKNTVVAVDENRLNEVPEKFLRYKDPEVDKKAVREALKAGEAVPGCTLAESVSMIIK